MNLSSTEKEVITGVILAGGEAKRMHGQDKGLIEINDKTMIEHVIIKFEPQVSTLIINANRNIELYNKYGFPVINDEFSGFMGPLAGMASCMQYIETKLMVTVPCDSPFIPDDLVARLFIQMKTQQADISVAHNGERIQPVFTLMKISLYNSLEDFLNRGERKIDKWFAQHKTVITDFSDKPDTFININTPEERNKIESRLTPI